MKSRIWVGRCLGLTVGANEALNVRGTGWIRVGKVNGCQDGGSESREATDGEKLQIGVRKAINSSESRGSGLGLAYGKLNGGFESGGIV